MSKVAAYVPAPEAAPATVAWSEYFANVMATAHEERQLVDYFCSGPRGGEETVEAVDGLLDGRFANVVKLPRIEALEGGLEQVREAKAETLIAGVADLPKEYAGDIARALLRRSPCRTYVVVSGDRRPEEVKRVLVLVSDSAHDRVTFEVGLNTARRQGGQLTLATIEDDVGSGAEGLGERALQQFLRGTSATDEDDIETKVVVDNHPVRGVVRAFDDHDLVLTGASNLDVVKSLGTALGGAVVGVVKRQPPLRRRSLPEWIPQVNPADYAELAQNLREGSRWSADFVVMLGLASAIATLGLIQNSPAVVIGSMLLAPLMTPMLGFGLALAQSNGRMARISGRSIVQGFLLTLLVSFVFGFLSFRETLSPEVMARTEPNILDLGIAFFAAMAAAFALARPSLSGAVAGVAIATALVPPVCSCGVSLAHGEILAGAGAAVLFLTNLLAIVVASALTFTLMGVSVPHTFSRAKRMTRHAMIALVLLLMVLAGGLGWALNKQLDRGRAMPIAYPVTRAVAQAVIERVTEEPGVEVMLLGQGSVVDGVVIYLASDRDVDKEFRDELRAIVKEEMHDPDITVYVIVVRSAMDDWSKEEERPDAR